VSIWGKIIGGAAGLALGGPIGALLGAVAGHAVDKMTGEEASGPIDETASTRKVAFTIGVIVLSAKMAKADGVVTKDEIAAFREVFHVPDDETRNVGRVWDQARKDVAGFELYAQQIAKLFNPGSPVLEELLGSLLHIAKADGVVHENELAYLKRVAEIFGIDELAFQRLLSVHGAATGNDPYGVLGVEPGASDDEIKSVYRKLIRENHPDRLIAEGMPEEFVRQANEKMAAINAAYDDIRKARGMN
jgi:DnaJ like chaperone protein